jgi:hypothetical protein
MAWLLSLLVCRPHITLSMIFDSLADALSGPNYVQVRTNALRSAIVLRDCSLRLHSDVAERRACRILMRVQADKWRRPGVAHPQNW